MKCYYEVLNIPRDADDAEIKSTYKKLALRWHPDKNLADPETAKETFQLVQQAYEVLSDRQERAWYDSHREQILHGSNKDYEDNCLDVFQYFTSSCYKGFGDDEAGFYAVYCKVFEEIAKEDLDHMENKEEFCSIPMFGKAESDYDTVVRPFYNYWMSYSTKRSYVWLDPYDIRDEKRRIIKLIEKENKKVRAQAKKERNEEVRNLVAFVRKRDKRVQTNVKLLEKKAKENKLRSEEMAKQARRERHAESKTVVQGEWTKFDNVKDELENIEKQLAEQFNDQEVDEDEEEDDLYCVACNKVFRTPKAFANHESSKKHRENVERLKEEMLEDEEDFEDEEKEDLANLDMEDVCVENDSISDAEETNDLEIEEETSKSKKKKKGKKKSIITLLVEDDIDVDLEEIEASRKTRRKKESKNLPNITPNEETPTEDSELATGVDNGDETKDSNSEICSTADSPLPSKQKKTKKSKGKKLTDDKNDFHANDDIDIEHTCVTCNGQFQSKNKLFDHLKKTGHGVYIDKNIKSGGSSSKPSKGKDRRNKRDERRKNQIE